MRKSQYDTKQTDLFGKSLDSIEKELDKQREEAGLNEFFQIPEGETKIIILPAEIRKVEGKWGNRYIFQIKVGRQEYALGVGERSPLLRQIVAAVKQGKTTLTIIRAGTGKNTRYSIKEAK